MTDTIVKIPLHIGTVIIDDMGYEFEVLETHEKNPMKGSVVRVRSTKDGRLEELDNWYVLDTFCWEGWKGHDDSGLTEVELELLPKDSTKLAFTKRAVKEWLDEEIERGQARQKEYPDLSHESEVVAASWGSLWTLRNLLFGCNP